MDFLSGIGKAPKYPDIFNTKLKICHQAMRTPKAFEGRIGSILRLFVQSCQQTCAHARHLWWISTLHPKLYLASQGSS